MFSAEVHMHMYAHTLHTCDMHLRCTCTYCMHVRCMCRAVYINFVGGGGGESEA